ncbi:MAG: hypothetical protein AAF363_15625 [Bacteroidota bacterium]
MMENFKLKAKHKELIEALATYFNSCDLFRENLNECYDFEELVDELKSYSEDIIDKVAIKFRVKLYDEPELTSLEDVIDFIEKSTSIYDKERIRESLKECHHFGEIPIESYNDEIKVQYLKQHWDTLSPEELKRRLSASFSPITSHLVHS